MEATAGKRRPLFDLETWLRSPWGRLAFVVAIVLALSASSAFQIVDAWERMNREIDGWDVFWRRILYWSMWGTAAVPIFFFARWTFRRAGNAAIFFAIQLPLSWFATWGIEELHDEVRDSVFGRQESPFDRPRGRRDGGRPSNGGFPSNGSSAEDRDRRGDGERRADGERTDRPRNGDRRGADGRRWDLFRGPSVTREVLLYWMILALGGAVQAFLTSRDQERRAAEGETRAATLAAELARAQVDSLRGQVRPHFLFNALNTVSGLIREDQGDVALRMISALGTLLRTTLDQDEQEVSVRDELAVAERYLEIERMRFGQRLAVDVDAAEEALSGSVPALLLLPLIENAVRYGVAPRTEGGRVRVVARREADELVLEVWDDGPGFPADVLSGSIEDGERNHIGLANGRERLRALYGERASMQLENEGGAHVLIRMPFSPSDSLDPDA